MKKLNILVITLFSVLFSACESAPKEVRLEKEQLSKFEIDLELFSFEENVVGLKSGKTVSCSFPLSAQQFPLFKTHSEKKGFAEWKKGGVNFGHLNMGWRLEEEVYYSTKEWKDKSLVLCYDKSAERIYFITFG